MAHDVRRLLKVTQWAQQETWAEEFQKGYIAVWRHAPNGFDFLIFALVLDPDMKYLVLGSSEVPMRREVRSGQVRWTGGEGWEGPCRKKPWARAKLPPGVHAAFDYYLLWGNDVIAAARGEQGGADGT